MEDKIVQRAVVMILKRIYEVDFCDTSYGFRPGRSCHGALSVLGQIIATRKVNWISDADIRGFFDNVCHERLVELLRHRVRDPQMLGFLVERFLKSGVMIEGQRLEAAKQASRRVRFCRSTVDQNVYLHYVLVKWPERNESRDWRGKRTSFAMPMTFCVRLSWSRMFGVTTMLSINDWLGSRWGKPEKTKLLRFNLAFCPCRTASGLR